MASLFFENCSTFAESKNDTPSYTRYGKIGANGATQVKDHDSAAAAKKFAEKQEKAKIRVCLFSYAIMLMPFVIPAYCEGS
jgi:hypothetical protein